jgi:hypothetical protein
MQRAFWSPPFQMIITLFQWLGSTAADVTDLIGTEMECQAHYEEVRRGNRGYPTTALEEMERGGSPFIPSFFRE